MTTLIPKIKIDGYTSNEPFVKFTQNYQWTGSNYCLSIENGYTNLNGLIFNGSNGNHNNIYLNNSDQNMIFGITGNANYIYNINNNEKIRINTDGNIGINNNNPQYKLDINGSLNASNNIYKNNIELDNIYLLIKNNYWLSNNNSVFIDPNSNILNIGIGNSTPFGTLHIGSHFNSNIDANIIISKLDSNLNSRNFKIGYDNNFNLILGDFGDASSTSRIWNSQFYINYKAPSNSFIINSNGNIGINTDNTTSYKVNINGSLNSLSLSGLGCNITNLDYNNITSNKPNLSNLNNWIYDSNSLNLYNNFTVNSKVGIGTTNAGNYRLNVNGSLNCSSLFFNGNDINNVFLNTTTAASTYFSIVNAIHSNAWIKNESSLQVTLNNSIRNYSVGIGTLGNSENVLLNVTGIISAYKLSGNGANITNIAYNNINGVPLFLLNSDAINTYYSKNYMDTTYSNNLSSNIANIYGTKTDIERLSANLVQAYNNISPQFITSLASKLNSGVIAIIFSNIQELPFNVNYNLKTFGFGLNTPADTINSNNIITIGGTLTANTIKCIGDIYENNNLLSNIYVSSNNFNNNIIYYDKIVDRIISSCTSNNYYPPSSYLSYNTNYSNIVSNASNGNGLYIIQSSTNLLGIETIPAYKIFDTSNVINDISWTTFDTDEGGRYSLLSYYYNNTTNSNNITPILLQNNNIEYLYGHWIQLYYSEKFILSDIELIVNNLSNIPHAPKTITLLASNDAIITSSLNIANTISRSWTKLLDNYIISNYSSNTSNDINNIKITLSNNIIPYNYYRIVISQVQASTFLILNKIRLSGVEFKKEWNHSGSNIYTYNNISIGTINNLSPYNLNVNGLIYSSSNIYAQSNIGIGITSPLGNLHIGNASNISDGTLIISKNNNTNNRNFKIGYDNNFNFVLGDYGNSNNSTLWTPQFYINSNASANSLIIDNNGNIGINTDSTIYKLYVNGSSYFNGSSNIFNNNIIASNNINILSNLNVSNIDTNNFTASNTSRFLNILSALSNVGIGTTNNFNGTLHIQSIYNTTGIWNVCDNLNPFEYISQFIGKNNSTSNGFYYTYNHIANNNSNNYVAFNCSQNILTLTANNTVGIGITNPTGVFQIGNGGKLSISKNDNDYAILGLLNTDSISNTKIYLNGISQNIEYYANTGSHKFYTSNIERLIIDNIGNIGINTIDTSIYKLNINGNIYTSSNLFVNSNIGIGITSPLGNLHIGTPSNISDGTFIISKNDNINNRNFKFGYDNDFNFIMGDYGNLSNNTIWKKQFYINSNAPDISLIINSNGFIGINNSNPLGYLHIGANNYISDGSLIISKNDNINNRNFKIGYDTNFNFVIGDYGNISNSTIWKKQFYINSNAPDNSLIINSNGNIGIGTETILPTQKLLVNGDTHIIGAIIQSNIANNIFNGTLGIGTTNSQSYNLNVQGIANISTQLYNSNLFNSNLFIQNGPVKIGSTVNSSTEPSFNFYVNSTSCFDGNLTLRGGSLSHTGGILTLNSTTININNTAFFNSITSINSNLGIGTTTSINNILQVGDGGKLRISNNNTDYSVIGTIDGITSTTNTRIIINGSSKTIDSGNIEYYTTGIGNHIFYSGGSNINELLKIDQNGNVGIGLLNTSYKLNVNGTTNINGELNVINQIKENSSYLSNIYVKLANLSNLSINNINLKKKFGYNLTIGGSSAFLYNGSNYYKYDIQISNLTQFATRTINSISVNYRIFNIKCFLPDGIFETFNNGLPNILQYDVYMSSNPLTPLTTPSIIPTNGLNICAIGTPENYSLSNILPTYITLLRTNTFNYLSLVSPNSNLSVAYIIEDYLS